MEQLVPFGGEEYWVLLAMLIVARGLDFFSTWVATPNLLLEANPIARWLGWRVGLVVNAALSAGVAVWPLPALIIATTSVLVAARNFQSAWLMRCMGEESYRCWMGQRLRESRYGFYLFCLVAHTGLTMSVGALLMYASPCSVNPRLLHLAPFAVGAGIVVYGLAVLFYTWLSIRRVRRVVE